MINKKSNNFNNINRNNVNNSNNHNLSKQYSIKQENIGGREIASIIHPIMTLELSPCLFKNLMHFTKLIEKANVNMEIRVDNDNKKLTFCPPEECELRPFYILNLENLVKEKLAKVENCRNFRVEILVEDFLWFNNILEIKIPQKSTENIIFKFNQTEEKMYVEFKRLRCSNKAYYHRLKKTNLTLARPFQDWHIRIDQETYKFFKTNIDNAMFEFCTRVVKFQPKCTNTNILTHIVNDQEIKVNHLSMKNIILRQGKMLNLNESNTDINIYSLNTTVSTRIFSYLPNWNRINQNESKKKIGFPVRDNYVYFYFMSREDVYATQDIEDENFIRNARMWAYTKSNIKDKIIEEMYFESKIFNVNLGDSNKLIEECFKRGDENENENQNQNRSINTGNRNNSLIFTNNNDRANLNDLSSFVANNTSQNANMCNIIPNVNNIDLNNNIANNPNSSNFSPVIKEEYLRQDFNVNNISSNSVNSILSHGNNRDHSSYWNQNNDNANKEKNRELFQFLGSGCNNINNNINIQNKSLENNLTVNRAIIGTSSSNEKFSNANFINNIESNIPASNRFNASSSGNANYLNMQNRLNTNNVNNNIRLQPNTSKGLNAWMNERDRVKTNNNFNLIDEKVEFDKHIELTNLDPNKLNNFLTGISSIERQDNSYFSSNTIKDALNNFNADCKVVSGTGAAQNPKFNPFAGDRIPECYFDKKPVNEIIVTNPFGMSEEQKKQLEQKAKENISNIKNPCGIKNLKEFNPFEK